MLKTPIGRLRAIGMLEGTSFLFLLGVGMPLKYLADLPEVNMVAGWLHGLLFVLYFVAVLQASAAREWPFSRMALAMLAAVLPFGPFVFDRKLREEAEATTPIQGTAA